MIPLEQITEQELERRFGLLPDKLKDALDSARNNKIVDGVCRNHHLVDEEKILSIRQIVGIVLFGYIHSYDVAGELNGWLELNNPQLAASIAQELDVKIFSPLKAELEANYHPLTEGTFPSLAKSQQPPTIIQEINPSTSLRVDAVRRIEKPIDTVAFAGSPTAGVKIRDLSQVVAPFGLAPSTQLGINQGKPKPLDDLPTAPFDSTQGKPKPLGELSTVPISPFLKPMPPPGLATLPSKSEIKEVPVAPAPFMIRTEPEFKPLQSKGDAPRFDASLKMWSEVKPGVMPIPRPARVDLGEKTNEEPRKSIVGRTEIPEPRIIHYSQWKTPVEKAPLSGGPVPLAQIASGSREQGTTTATNFPVPPPPMPPPQQETGNREQGTTTEKKIAPPPSPRPPVLGFSAPLDLSKMKPEPPKFQMSDVGHQMSDVPPKPPAPPREIPKKTGENVVDLSRL